jgi:hypothetical protein
MGLSFFSHKELSGKGETKMLDHITSNPLCWPPGWKRTAANKRTHAKFKKYNSEISIAGATRFVLQELQRMGIPDFRVIISSDLRLRMDGLPYSNQSSPDDPGVAVWWSDENSHRVIALDKYCRIADNLHAVGKTIEALRGIERWGGGEILQRTFTGFLALPSSTGTPRTWRDVLDYHGDNIEYAEAAFLKARSASHPDKGGSDQAFVAVQQAWEQAQTELQ